MSVASLWEIVIKVALGKLRLTSSFEEVIPSQLQSNDIQVLGIGLTHLGELSRLPQHHKDPFDRLIISQAIAEGIPLLSKDGDFEEYPVALLW